MADKNDSGDKTEKPTPKKLKDARKKGDVAKSKDVSSTGVMILWIVLLGLSLYYIIERFAALLSKTLSHAGKNVEFDYLLSVIGRESYDTLIELTALLIIPAAILGTLVEFLQAGPVMTLEKVKPKMEHLNPATGIKRMFSMDNLVEVIKSIAKTALLFLIGWLILTAWIPDLVKLPQTMTDLIGTTFWGMLLSLLIWSIGIFLFIAILDAGYQRFSYIKKLRMSMRDIKQEHKENEGDPMIKQQRRQAHQEWSQQSAAEAAGAANVIVVNPTHLAIALDYDREKTPVPTVSAKGEDLVARAMRESAQDAHVPILRNVDLARSLYTDTKEGDVIPSELFDVMAEVILWATQVRKNIENELQEDDKKSKQIKPPGEDLTCYPDEVVI
ncbi:MAG: type III secretion system export apparatus subunit SctU [Candidatus Thiodiazotropha weberae]|uniref:EscU/YscU/HrcU family type III secretion system export apparatus switch protein n=1 Tax=Candidatus Thiodiazotropha endoloripes TaxID=1818881 RepID=A0A1E2USU0_9GAMM|nr:type III secretion system export apparatus subunit SctU [Candidatus Thiodiazotropha endoloripes]MCG7899725.1 type III secretion system export apparatus subunit SctU [Candidatus Thiodiazotropha weberae]MCG7901298.1 type III secretion system export apparatus subunit SctU [Candidatus Thiodiazotropha weberae]ODB97800.1 EscU/YscU/HrcU family type III secretion system export apparatus switch protein [Candidatus Thiodiazotropha endoloripes]